MFASKINAVIKLVSATVFMVIATISSVRADSLVEESYFTSPAFAFFACALLGLNFIGRRKKTERMK